MFRPYETAIIRFHVLEICKKRNHMGYVFLKLEARGWPFRTAETCSVLCTDRLSYCYVLH
jgi:hypothetical protein